MDNTKGSSYFLLAAAVVLLGTAILVLLSAFLASLWTQQAKAILSALPWIYSGLAVFFGVLSLVGTWRIAKNTDEKNEDKTIQGLKLTVGSAAVTLMFQIAATLGFVETLSL